MVNVGRASAFELFLVGVCALLVEGVEVIGRPLALGNWEGRTLVLLLVNVGNHGGVGERVVMFLLQLVPAKGRGQPMRTRLVF